MNFSINSFFSGKKMFFCPGKKLKKNFFTGKKIFTGKKNRNFLFPKNIFSVMKSNFLMKSGYMYTIFDYSWNGLENLRDREGVKPPPN